MKKTFGKITAAALSLILVFLMAFTAGAAEFQGEGTKSSPYIIANGDDLDKLSELVANGEDFKGKYFSLSDSVTANSTFVPIGTEAVPFAGIFEGNGNTLSGFNIKCDYAAVFAFTDGAVIRDLTVSGTFSAKNYAGSVAAMAENTVIENCTGSATVNADSFVGGIVGYITSGKISNCQTSPSAMIGGYVEYCGGIAGKSDADITGCTNKAYTYGKKNVGGIAGASSADIISCTNSAIVAASAENLGGITGLTEGTVRYSKNSGSISPYFSAPITKVGGITGVGYLAVIEECHNSGKVSASSNFAGGIAGYLTGGSVTNCLSTADVSTDNDFAGGIFGYALNSKVSKCVFSATASSANEKAAGIGGLAQCETDTCYYDSDNNTAAVYTGTASNTEGVYSALFTNEASFGGLDFDNVWVINTSHGSYPLLSALPYHTVTIFSQTEADCTNDGIINGICTLCQEELETVIPATGHSITVVSSKLPSCTVSGYKDTLCTVCGEADSETLPETGHSDADGNSTCDVCSANIKTDNGAQTEKNIFQKIVDFFRSILEWIRNLFS